MSFLCRVPHAVAGKAKYTKMSEPNRAWNWKKINKVKYVFGADIIVTELFLNIYNVSITSQS